MQNIKNKQSNSSTHRPKSDMTGAGPQSGFAATGTVLGIVCSALLGSFLYYWIGALILFGILKYLEVKKQKENRIKADEYLKKEWEEKMNQIIKMFGSAQNQEKLLSSS